jgi:CRISPR-associated protein (TIGR03986 family)
MIHSPYNFVPLSDKVVSPYWTKHVSHDIPFDDAQSGTLELTLTAESDIFVRNGAAETATNNHDFSNINGKYFIPGSSMQGALRGVLEIMSFGRMANKVNDHRYSVRDFHNNNIYDIAEIAQSVCCGWLKKVDGEYLLQDCGEPGRISHAKIDVEFVTAMSAFFQVKENVRPNAKSAKFKYDRFSTVEGVKSFTSTKVGLRLLCDFDTAGKEGKIVLTGQPGHRYEKDNGEWTGKHLEFVFFETIADFKKVDEKIIQNFFFAYYDHDKNAQKEDWRWRKPQLDAGKAIPVFFRKDSKGNIIDMGLSYLYKITYKNSIKESIDKTQKQGQNFDLAETIFGYTEGKHDFLKSRVHIGHAFAVEGTAKPNVKVTEVLSGPKASYYPSYIAQNSNDDGIVKNYSTFMNERPQIAGWKRYPIQDSIKHNPASIKNGVANANVGTSFIPLQKGVQFKLSISYHNLRKEELGALISAITFHNTDDSLFHSIGMAKPLGYGKTTISIDNIDENLKMDCLKAYESYMNIALGFDKPEWHKSEQLKELFAMAKGSKGETQPYMSLDKKEESFVNAKKNREALQSFSKISNNNIAVTSLIDNNDIAAAKENHTKNEKIFNEKIYAMEYPVEFAKDCIRKKEDEINALIEVKKQVLMQQLTIRKQALLEAQNKDTEDKKNEYLATLKNTGFTSNIKDFDDLKKEIGLYLKKLKYETLPQTDYETVTQKIIQSFQNLKSNKDKAKWKEEPFAKNAYFKKTAEWLGTAKATEIFEQLKNM